ncbi:MAG: glycosyltransferase family 87 protein [Terriglobales bacterium]
MYNWRTAAAVLSIGLALIYAILFFQMRRPLQEGYSDFISFYTAGKILQRGLPSQLYEIKLQSQIQHEIAPNVQIRQGALPFVRPAFEAWLFWPLAHFSYRVAFVLWNLFNAACLILAILCLRREIPDLHDVSPLLMVASGLTYFPVFFTILQGQDSILVLLIYVMGYRELRRHRQFLGGMTLGLGIFKFPLLIPFLIPFAVKRKFRVVGGFALTSLALAAVSIGTVGLPTAAYYPKYLLSIDRIARGINRPQDMPNLRGLLSVLLPALAPTTTGILLLLLLSIVLLTLVVRQWSSAPFDPDAAFTLGIALNVVATVLVSYHCHAFDLCILLLPIGLALGFVLSKQPIAPDVRKLLIWLLGAMMFSPLYLLIVFTANIPSLLAILLIAFTFAVGLTISEVRKMPIFKKTEASATIS